MLWSKTYRFYNPFLIADPRDFFIELKIFYRLHLQSDLRLKLFAATWHVWVVTRIQGLILARGACIHPERSEGGYKFRESLVTIVAYIWQKVLKNFKLSIIWTNSSKCACMWYVIWSFFLAAVLISDISPLLRVTRCCVGFHFNSILWSFEKFSGKGSPLRLKGKIYT